MVESCLLIEAVSRCFFSDESRPFIFKVITELGVVTATILLIITFLIGCIIIYSFFSLIGIKGLLV